MRTRKERFQSRVEVALKDIWGNWPGDGVIGGLGDMHKRQNELWAELERIKEHFGLKPGFVTKPSPLTPVKARRG